MNQSVAITKEFIEWKSSFSRHQANDKTVYEVPGHYKFLDEQELVRYYFDVVKTFH